MCGKREKGISKCGGGWTPSVGVTSSSLTQLLLIAKKRFAPRAKINRPRAILPPDAANRAQNWTMSKLVPAWTIAPGKHYISRWMVDGGWWMVDGGYGLEAVRVLLLLHTLVHARSWPGPGLSRPEDYGQVSTSSFGGSFGFLAFGPRWRQEVVASGRQWSPVVASGGPR